MTKFTYDHIHLRSPNPEATARYYERMFGAEVIRTMQQGKPRIDLKLGGVNIFIAPVAPGDGVNPPPQHTVSGPRSLRPVGEPHRCSHLRARCLVRRLHQRAT